MMRLSWSAIPAGGTTIPCSDAYVDKASPLTFVKVLMEADKKHSFDVSAIFSRSLPRLQRFLSIWLTQAVETWRLSESIEAAAMATPTTPKPTCVILPEEVVPVKNEYQQRELDRLFVDMAKVLGLKSRRISINEEWAANPP